MNNTLRIAFPVTMFALAVVSFAYGTWQYFALQSAEATEAGRLAYILETIEGSDLTRVRKQELYATLAAGLPAAQPVLGIDISGSYASEEDGCDSDGQRTLCRALQAEGTDPATFSAVCDVCLPR
jgi:hypothetical protein